MTDGRYVAVVGAGLAGADAEAVGRLLGEARNTLVVRSAEEAVELAPALAARDRPGA